MGVDVARFGNDKSVIAKMEGNLLYAIDQWEKIDTATFGDIVKSEIISEGIDDINVGVDVGQMLVEANTTRHSVTIIILACTEDELIPDVPAFAVSTRFEEAKRIFGD